MGISVILGRLDRSTPGGSFILAYGLRVYLFILSFRLRRLMFGIYFCGTCRLLILSNFQGCPFHLPSPPGSVPWLYPAFLAKRPIIDILCIQMKIELFEKISPL